MDAAAERLHAILYRIAEAAQSAGRKPEDITLVAVTKTIPLQKVKPFLDAGLSDIGENRVQEALGKYGGESEKWKDRPVFHLIGPLQSNKAKKAAEFFDWIQTVDRLDLAEALNRNAMMSGKTLECLVQVKISDEATKSGVLPDRVPELVDKISALPNLELRGLMGIPPLSAQGDSARPYFQRLRRLFEQTSRRCPSSFNVLSMGMSSDFEAAIAEGATMVRIGTALFGAR